LKIVYICVINDLVTDQRVHRVAELLKENGAHVTCIGRRLRHSQVPEGVSFRYHRFFMLFTVGPLFYAFFNLRLLLFLLFELKPALIIANDLDTLPAAWLASRIRGVKLIYDSHELFTQVPELVGRRRVQAIWKYIESRIVPRLDCAVTVSRSIARIYYGLYRTPFRVVRNVPKRKVPCTDGKMDSDFPGKRVIIYQGALNMGRGLELMIETMEHLKEVVFLVVGTGDIDRKLRDLARTKGLGGRVVFTGRLSPGEVDPLTCAADLGISLEEDLGLNYRYALPNKLFDYIQARIPVLCSDLPEMAGVVQTYGVGITTPERDPEKLATIIRSLLGEIDRGSFREALEKAAAELCWEKEKTVYKDLLVECGFL